MNYKIKEPDWELGDQAFKEFASTPFGEYFYFYSHVDGEWCCGLLIADTIAIGKSGKSVEEVKRNCFCDYEKKLKQCLNEVKE